MALNNPQNNALEGNYRKIIPMAMLLLVAIFLISSSASAVQYFQQKSFVYKNITDNSTDTIKTHTIFVWDFGNVAGDDAVKSDNFLEMYYEYDLYPQKWNSRNPSYLVDYCNISIYFSASLESGSTLLYSRTIHSNESDVFRDKYFVKLKKGDTTTADIFCKFQNNFSELEFPTRLTIVTPTWECKSCQMYEWSVSQRTISKTETIGDNIVGVIDYIKKIILVNYEIFVALWWILLFALTFTGFGLIFFALFWLYVYLRRYTR